MSKLINTIPKRIGVALILGAIVHLIIAATQEEFLFDILEVVKYAAISYIVVTLLNAVVTTFFVNDDSNDQYVD